MQKTVKRSTVNALGCLLLLSLVSACASSQAVKPIVISAKPVDKPELILPKADRIQTRDVKWIVITPENYQEVFNQLAKDGKQVVLFALTSDGYENVSLNLSDIRAYIQQQQAIILAYEGYYLKSNSAIDAANEEIVNATQEAVNAATPPEKPGFSWNPFN
jgi:hypothetical protein